MALPSFLLKKIPKRENIRRIRTLLDDNCIHTVCEEARCPNIGECFSQGTCTFLILGDTCTRNCAFCGVNHGKPQPPDPEEPRRIAEAVGKLNLNYVVITSVTRDDLPNGGASQFVKVIKKLIIDNCKLKIEVLIPDFQGSEKSLKTVLDAKPYVLNHNLETAPRLYPKIRPQANYDRSLKILKFAKEHRPPKLEERRRVYTKSGFMVGLGESRKEVFSVLRDLKAVGCDIVTIGQYLPPSKNHPKPERFIPPEEFETYQAYGKRSGFLKVFSGPFVRSSYHAKEIYEKI